MSQAKQKTQKTTEVVEVKQNQVASIDSIYGDVGDEYSHQFSKDQLIIPRISVLQSGSPQVKKSDAAYIKGAEEGMIYNSATGELYDGAEGIFIVALTNRRTNIEWNGKTRSFVADHGANPTAFDISKLPRKDGRIKNGDNDVVPTEDYIGFMLDSDYVNNGLYTPVALSMSATNLKIARQWNSMMNMVTRKLPDGSVAPAPLFAKIYKLSTAPKQNDKGSWFVWKVEPVSFSHEVSSLRFGEPKGFLHQCKDFIDQLRSGAAVVAEHKVAEESDDDAM